MGPKRLAIVLAMLMAWSMVASSDAQTVRARQVDDLISRPADRSASTQIGGRFTGARRNTLQSTQRDVNLLGRSQDTFFRAPNRRRMGNALATAVSRLQSPLSTGGMPPWARPTWKQSSRISGLTQSMLLTRPLVGSRAAGLPALDAYKHTPRHERDRFHDFFGLQPTPPAQDPNTSTVPTIAEQLGRQVETRVSKARDNALNLFRSATIERRNPRTGRYPNCRDCEENLARSTRLFRLVRDLDDDAYLPSLLMAHAALDQERPTLATVYVLEAFARAPETFLESADQLHSYFGDTPEPADPNDAAADEVGTSGVLTAQLNRYVRIGELNTTAADAQVLSAYCAWQLGDRVRALEALQRASELLYAAEQTGSRERMLSFVTALEQELTNTE